MPTIYIRGETGATLGPDRVKLYEGLKAVNAVAEYRALADDVFRWTAETYSINANETTIPDVGQKVSLYLDETRIFHGHVVDTELVSYGVNVGVYGPHWWLNRNDAVSQVEDDEGTLGERPTLQFETGDIGAHVTSLIELASDGYGIPAWAGTVPTIYDIPTVSYSLQSLAGVLARLLEWCPDAVAWWDHSALSSVATAVSTTQVQFDASASSEDDIYNGLEFEVRTGPFAGTTAIISDYVGSTKTATFSPAIPTGGTNGQTCTIEIPCRLNVTRRASATERVHDLADGAVQEGLSFRPRIEYETAQVSLPYVDRNPATGVPRWQLQEAGTFTRGKRQIVPVSGPELVDFLPFDDFGSYVRNVAVYSSLTIEIAAGIFDGTVAAAFAAGMSNGFQGLHSYSVSFVGANYSMGSSGGGPYNSFSYTVPGPQVRDLNGNFVNMTNKKVLLTPNPPQWWVDEFSAQKVRITGSFHTRLAENQYGFGGIPNEGALSPPSWFNSVDMTSRLSGFYRRGSKVYAGDVWTAPYSIETYVVPLSVSNGSSTDLKALEFAFQNPPSGLAANLLAASNFVPWEGTIPWQLQSLAALQPLSEVHSVDGLLPSAATAKALPREYVIDLQSHLARVDLGVPSRSDYRTLVGKTKRNPQDNIIRL